MAVENSDVDDSRVENSTEDNEDPDHLIVELVKRLAFPTFVLVFCLMYFNSTWNRLDTGALTYPYIILLFTLVFLILVYIHEIQDIYDNSSRYRTISDSIARLLSEWQVSIGVILVAVGYLYVMDFAGFFPSSFVAIVLIMYLGSVTDWRTIGSVSIFTLVMVYILFVVILGIQPPSGYVQIEFTAPW